MKWLVDMPAELRLQVYAHFCESTPIMIHNVDDPDIRNCDFLRKSKCQRRASAVSLLLACKAVKAEFEPIFFSHTSFVAHYESSMCCFYITISDGSAMPVLRLFKPIERRELHSYFARENVQMHLKKRLSTTPSSSFMRHGSERFTISGPLGCSRDARERQHELKSLVTLMSFCRGRVNQLEFWYHPVRWLPAEAALPWRITMDREGNFTIRGLREEGFFAMKEKLVKALRMFLPSHEILHWWSCTARERSKLKKAGAGFREPQFTFINDATDSQSDHVSACMAESWKAYEARCNCGEWKRFGGIRDVE